MTSPLQELKLDLEKARAERVKMWLVAPKKPNTGAMMEVVTQQRRSNALLQEQMRYVDQVTGQPDMRWSPAEFRDRYEREMMRASRRHAASIYGTGRIL